MDTLSECTAPLAVDEQRCQTPTSTSPSSWPSPSPSSLLGQPQARHICRHLRCPRRPTPATNGTDVHRHGANNHPGRRKAIIFNHNLNRRCRPSTAAASLAAAAAAAAPPPTGHRMTSLLMAVMVAAIVILADPLLPTAEAAISGKLAKEPTFLSRSESFKFKYNETITLPCDVQNADNYMVAWKRGIAILTAGQVKVTPDPRIRLVAGYSLQIANAVPQDAGDYICQIAMLHPREITHMVEILIPPKINRSPPPSIPSKKGETVSMECLASGNPIPNVTWTRKNNLLLPNGETTMLGTSITIDYMDPNKGGIYIYTANNGVGMPISGVVDIQVMYAPEITVEQPIVYTREGAEAELTCIVNGNRIPEVTWFKSTMQLDITERYNMDRRGSRYSLTIRNVQRSDFANYTCTAENPLGKVRRYVTLTGKPNVAVMRSSDVGPFKDRYNLTWSVQSAAPILETRISYRRMNTRGGADGKRGGGGGGGLNGGHGGGGGGGGHGSGAVHDTELIENDLMSMHQFNMYKTSASYWPLKSDWLDVVLPHSGGPSMAGVELDQRLSYLIRDLQRDTMYEANITSKNAYGWGDQVAHVTFKTAFADSYYEPSDHSSLTGSERVLGVINYENSAASTMVKVGTIAGFASIMMALVVATNRLQQRA